MKIVKKLPKSFFTKNRDSVNEKKSDKYSKIEEIKWNKDVLSGKNKVIGSLPSRKKVL